MFATSANACLTATEQKTAAAVLGQAFEQDPFMSYLLPNAETRVQRLAKLFLPLIRSSLRCGGVVLAPGGGGALVWLSGDAFSWPLKALELFRSGLIWIPSAIGLSAFKRLQAHDSVCEQALLKHAPQDFAYLWVVGVHPDHAGQGLGKKMIQSALNTMRQRGYSTCWLRTENAKNVGLYEYLGFTQVLTETPEKSGMQYWLMSQDL
ncbi:GNAT family N-acetyltransferase [filamentous cyanobacterium LEGE 11480]|uniref:GNAT family N-acetyltransferase n=1 Tax=Romeriopsis navalis LEGE 11480 TaxID=2777977 RepID=A0A928Z3P2_9CYAN|nr:GNAT family N-acetyltransferase [Romeriopsis navalis]MBE9029495.1 GNAT family N-acetyltransferase [Romeriopsis navalis LEGE 11480]